MTLADEQAVRQIGTIWERIAALEKQVSILSEHIKWQENKLQKLALGHPNL